MSLNKSKSLRAAEKYVLQGKIPSAIDEYRKVVDADPSDLTTINTLGDLYVRAGRIQDAIANFSRIAESYRESGFTLKAIAMLKKISKLDPTNVETSMKLANLYSQQGLLVEARQQYLQVADAYARAGHTRKALDAYQKIADLDPSNTSVRLKLGEIYSREGMMEQAHEVLIMAGTEFLRKGDTEQALNANLKAISINPESRQGLTAIATIYTQQGQADRAINILCDAFEKNPGDVDLLTILGRTYLSAGLMDDAEQTFLSLVELDRNRYHYLLEVGRRFLQMGNLDRAAEQIDGCLDVLISKREEDKAIDFLRRVLDRDLNHIGALKRLAQIFLRIREDHNLIATLNSLAEAAMRKGDDEEAIAALKELARLEPDESMHLQRLYTLGVRDIVEADSPDVVRATGPLDFESAAFDDAFVIRQISEAEILAGHGQVEHAVGILKEILNYAPENVQIHLKLKDIYLRAGMIDKASAECLDLARIYDARGESARASDFTAEAYHLDPLIKTSQNQNGSAWPSHADRGHGFDFDNPVAAGPLIKDSGLEMREPASGFDLSQYQTGHLTDHTGFVTVPDTPPVPLSASAHEDLADHDRAAGSSTFRYSDTLVGNSPGDLSANPIADMVFNSAGDLPSDTLSRGLRDELEGIDFYIAQGYYDIARDTLDRLREEHGFHAEIASRYSKLGSDRQQEPQSLAPRAGFGLAGETISPAAPVTPDSNNPGESSKGIGANGSSAPSKTASADSRLQEELAAKDGRFTVTVTGGPAEGERKNAMPFMVQKESGPLESDLFVQFNTSELAEYAEFLQQASEPQPIEGVKQVSPPCQEELVIDGPVYNGSTLRGDELEMDDSAPFDASQANRWDARPAAPQAGSERFGTADLIDSIVSSIDTSFDMLPGDSHAAQPEPLRDFALIEESPASRESVSHSESVGAEPATVSVSGGFPVHEGGETELDQLMEELRENTGDFQQHYDFETHYSLGLAYKDMDLFDEAIEQFQMAFRVTLLEELEGDRFHCCHMLGVCFRRKEMPKVAIMWFQRGLKTANRPEVEYQALRYEVGLCYEEIGDIDKALDAFMEVFGIDVSYREVVSKIKKLQAAKNT